MLKTVDEVVEALGGTSAAAEAAGVDRSAVSMWKARARIPANRFFLVSDLLKRSGKAAVDPAVFGFAEPPEAR